MLGLSFLGPTKYQEACYFWNINEHETFEYKTDLFPEVLTKIFPLTKLLVFVTDEVEKHDNCSRLKHKLGSIIETVNIPLGKSEEELWDIFSIITEQVPQQATVIIDITHAFRSLPLIAFNVASYLRRIKSIKVERILYGNFEARDANFDPPRTPIFDLTSTLDLQDWLHGIDAFQRRGYAEELSDSLIRTQDRLYQTLLPGGTARPRELKHIARQLKGFSEALRLLRPLEAGSTAAKVHDLLETVQHEASCWAKPFASVLKELTAEISPVKNKEPTALSIENLNTQINLIQYYLDKDLVVQAVLFAREWLVSYVMLLTDRKADWRRKAVRFDAERELGQVIAWQKKQRDPAILPSWYQQIPQADRIGKLWINLSSLRNDVAHCAMNTDAATPDTIRNKIKELISSLKALLIQHQ